MITDSFNFRIYFWMIKKYGLKGNDLLLFAYLHYFTVCMVEHGCVQTRKEMAEHLHISVYMIHKVMENLMFNKLVESFHYWDNGTPHQAYRTTVIEKGYEK